MVSVIKMLVITDENFDKEVLKLSLPVLVDFWAPWCGPCQMAGPVIEELAKEFEGKVKIGKMNVDENSQTPSQYGIMSIPTVIFFKDGKEFGRKIGFEGKEAYVKLISS